MNEELRALIWGDLHDDQMFPAVRPLLAHYTSIDTLEKILTYNEIWLSNPLYMNDLEELRFGMNEGASAFRLHLGVREACGSDERHAKAIYCFDYLFREFDEKHALNTYVLCLSEHDPSNNDGVLSMWRGYGASAGGAAIVFDSSKAEPNESSPLLIGKVTYSTRQDRLDWIKEKIDAVASAIQKAEQSDEALQTIIYYWIERLKYFSLFAKHVGFHEEKEWRIVYMSERDREQRYKDMLGYSITARGVEPKLKIRVAPIEGLFGPDISLERFIDRIILGPTVSSFLAASSFKRMLQIKGKQALAERVVPSTIPFRP